GRCLQRLLPAGGGAPMPRRLLPPARQQLLLLPGPPLVEQRPGRIEQPRRVDVCFGRDPADQRSPRLGREHVLEIPARLLRAGEHDAYVPQPSDTAVECIRDLSQMPVDDRLDVPLVARLRPAALVVATWNVGGL